MYDEKASTCKIVQILIFSDFLSPVERFVPLTSELRYLHFIHVPSNTALAQLLHVENKLPLEF